MLKTFIFAAAITLSMAAPSFGHAKLISSSPASGVQVSEAPKTIMLTFNEEARIAALTLVHEGKEMPVAVVKSAPAAKSLTLPVTVLVPGSYEVHWTAIASDDGHVTRGSFSFTVARASG